MLSSWGLKIPGFSVEDRASGLRLAVYSLKFRYLTVCRKEVQALQTLYC